MRRLTALVILLLLTVAWSPSFERPALCRYYSLYTVETETVLPLTMPLDRLHHVCALRDGNVIGPWQAIYQPIALFDFELPAESHVFDGPSQRPKTVFDWVQCLASDQAVDWQRAGQSATPERLVQAYPDFESLATTIVADFMCNPNHWVVSFPPPETQIQQLEGQLRSSPVPEYGGPLGMYPVSPGGRASRTLMDMHFIRRELPPHTQMPGDVGHMDWTWWSLVVW